MEKYERPIAELIDIRPMEALMLTPGSEELGDDWEEDWE